jgi:UDP-2,3-diacylglucosamine pyrophosphatase LpxH
MKIKKRKIDILVLSDIHLGSFGCRAHELLQYLHTIKPKRVILNGDIIDVWQFRKYYFPKSHLKVIRIFLSWLTKGVRVNYITGNHDEVMRRFKGLKIGTLSVLNSLVIKERGKTFWFFHGDVFDVTMKYSKWLAKLGGAGYDLLILINTAVNKISKLFGKGRVSLSQKVKDSVKNAVKYINDYEDTAISIAIDNHFDAVICGHIHQPAIKTVTTEKGTVEYLNSGDWIENLTALEYADGQWRLYKYYEDPIAQSISKKNLTKSEKKIKQLFQELVTEFDFRVA